MLGRNLSPGSVATPMKLRKLNKLRRLADEEILEGEKRQGPRGEEHVGGAAHLHAAPSPVRHHLGRSLAFHAHFLIKNILTWISSSLRYIGVGDDYVVASAQAGSETSRVRSCAGG